MIKFCKRFILLLNVIAAIVSSNNLQEICSFKYKTDFPIEEPLLIWNNELFIFPINDVIYISEGDKIMIACPGSTNSLVISGTEFIEATCVRNQTVKVEDVDYQLSDFNCTSAVTTEIEETTTLCGNCQGFMKNIGFNVNNTFFTLFNICYNKDNGEAVYTNHLIVGSALNSPKSENTGSYFKKNGLASGVYLKSYKQEAQLYILTELLGSAKLANQYIFPGSYLVPAHLTPDSDQVYELTSLSTYFFINTVPQWRQINNGNWKSLEFSIRRLASNTADTLQVITGGWEVLQFEDINGNLVDIYLSGNKLPVPKFIWKIAYLFESQIGIAFVSVNNPFLVSKDWYICKDICDAYGWGTTDWKNASRGLLYCCEVDELRKVVDTIPQFEVTDILEAPSTGDLLKRIFEM